MAEKLTLTKVVRKDTDKEGKKLVTKDGREYVRLAVQCREYGDKWVSFFGAPWNDSWKAGDVVDADVKANGEYLNGSKPDPLVDLTKHFMALSARVGKLEEMMKPKISIEASPATLPEPPDDSNLPF